MQKYLKAIKEIIRFKNAFDKIDESSLKVTRKLIGVLGEYYVLHELDKSRISFRHKGGSAGCDIVLANNVRIEVRTSLLKNEGLYPKGINFFGWRVKNKKQKKQRKFDFMIGVALDDTFKIPKFYIFTYDEACKVGDVENLGMFRNVQKKIHLFEDIKAMNNAIKSEPQFVTDYEIYINKHKDEFINKWSKMKNS